MNNTLPALPNDNYRWVLGWSSRSRADLRLSLQIKSVVKRGEWSEILFIAAPATDNFWEHALHLLQTLQATNDKMGTYDHNGVKIEGTRP